MKMPGRNFSLPANSAKTCPQNDFARTSTLPDVHRLSLATCEDPGVPLHGFRRGNTFIDGESVEYFCNRNYSLIGSPIIRCVEGRWSSLAPVCKGTK